MRNRNIQADVLNYISDGKLHITKEIASEIEISQITVKRHIQALSYRFNIKTFNGGIDKGGVRLIPDENVKTNYLSEDELQLIVSKLSSLQVDSPNIKKFVNSIAPLIEKRRRK